MQIISLELTPEEAFDLLDYLSESDYPKTEAVQDIIDELNYELEDVQPLDFDGEEEYENVVELRGE